MKLIEKFLMVLATALLSILATFAYNGVGSISRSEAEAIIEKREASHDSKIDLVMDRLNRIEVGQARLEEKVDALKEKR